MEPVSHSMSSPRGVGGASGEEAGSVDKAVAVKVVDGDRASLSPRPTGDVLLVDDPGADADGARDDLVHLVGTLGEEPAVALLQRVATR
jgi:hypothetical protein